MGYNRRALYLHRLAREVMRRYAGRLPTDPAALQTLPGVGPYTAAAVATFATGVPHPLADTNVKRVLTRVFRGGGAAPLRERELLRLMERTMPRTSVAGMRPALWGHALMDFGALVCKARPRCAACPLRRECGAYPEMVKGEMRKEKGERISYLNSHFRTPDRIYLGRILQYIRERDPHGVPLPELFPVVALRSRARLRRLVGGLVREGLLESVPRSAVRLPVSAP
jgi:A/G-specific adenine glycosylase